MSVYGRLPDGHGITLDGTAAAAIAVALTQEGFREGGNNENPWGIWDGIPNSAYCGQFVSWCYWAAGVPGDWRGADSQRYTPTAWNRWRQLGRLHTGANDGQPGDAALFDWVATSDPVDHVEIITANLGAGQYMVIGGNSNVRPQGVYHRRAHFGRDGIKGFGRPRFNPPTPTSRPPQPAAAVPLPVLTSTLIGALQ